MEEEIINKIIAHAKSIYSEIDIAHRWDHIQRVSDLAVFLAKKEGADVEVVKVASYLHDIGYRGMTTTEMVEKDHAAPSVVMAQEFLGSLGLEKDFIEKVSEAIDAHRSSRIHDKSSIEAQCVHDADKLEGAGVRGFMRIFSWDLLIEPRDLELNELVKFVRDSTLKRQKRLMTASAKELVKKFDQNAVKLVEMYEKEMNVK